MQRARSPLFHIFTKAESLRNNYVERIKASAIRIKKVSVDCGGSKQQISLRF